MAAPSESEDGRRAQRIDDESTKNPGAVGDHRRETVASGASRVLKLVSGVPQEQLLSQLQSDDATTAEHALDILYQAFFTQLWKVAHRLTGSQDIGEELVQDVFLGIWEQRKSLMIRDAISLYLHVAIRNRAYKYLRHTKVAERHVNASGHDIETSVHVSDPLLQIVASETDRAFLSVLMSLPPRDQDILILRWREGWSFDEIGSALGISSVAARVVVSRQQRRLRPLLERLRQELREG